MAYRPDSPRVLAVRLLQELSQSARTLDSLLQNPRLESLDVRDRGLLMELVYGTLRNRGLLDFYISQLTSRPLRRLDVPVLWILRTGLYQILFTRVPERAAVHETVDLCRAFRKTSAAGFVNGILRSFLRHPPAVPEDMSPESLSIRYSHPEWLVRRYVARYGVPAAVEMLEHNNTPPAPAVWVNPFRISVEDFLAVLREESIAAERCEGLSECVIVHAPAFSQHRLYREGYCAFVDPGSQRVANLAELSGRLRLGDFCAAPGGKSFILAAHKGPGAVIFSADRSFPRLQAMRERAVLHQIPDLRILCADLTAPVPFKEKFDFVLLDVPCSGLGTVGANPDIRWKIEEAHLRRFHDRQAAILEHGFDALCPGGLLLYSTCSTEPEENEDVINEFSARRPEASVLGDPYRSFPQPGSGGYFFAARIRHN